MRTTYLFDFGTGKETRGLGRFVFLSTISMASFSFGFNVSASLTVFFDFSSL